MKALIAEDNDLYRHILELVLIESGYKVSVAINGQDALKLLQEDVEEGFDLIVTDYEMPLVSGLQLIREIIKNNYKFKKLILLSGSLEVESFVKEFVNFKAKILVVAKDTPISHMKEKLFII